MRTGLLLLLFLLLAACQQTSSSISGTKTPAGESTDESRISHGAPPGPPAMIVFDTVSMNEQNQPHGWAASFKLSAFDDRVWARTPDKRFWISYPESQEIALAAEAVHEWYKQNDLSSSTRPSKEQHRIQYGFTRGGDESVHGLALYDDPSELPAIVQKIRRAVIDQYILHKTYVD